ncbi:MAG: hypothetical protein ABJP79_00615 [Tateyamaria sp.]|uniref:hypothetical protein n=1 Tax=Tateyamaria sp. TaxID=1929288 RepID=UPI00329C2E2B
MTQVWEQITVLEGDHEQIPCDCCGKTTTKISGDIEGPNGWLGFYFVRFSGAHPEHPAVFRIATGDWSDGALAENRWIFDLEYDVGAEGFRVLDTKSQGDGASATYLDRADIVGSSFAPEAFAMVDAIFMKDTRLAELHR